MNGDGGGDDVGDGSGDDDDVLMSSTRTLCELSAHLHSTTSHFATLSIIKLQRRAI